MPNTYTIHPNTPCLSPHPPVYTLSLQQLPACQPSSQPTFFLTTCLPLSPSVTPSFLCPFKRLARFSDRQSPH
ncbi:hypothetical protein E2C01_080088 [Portunus trituberculatus]|uniref:Uncharacterized protein n=1 Tax=Portunus trituberculatus TaxID=210409 RepID=A0A5B7IT39_PORTR|nr:hypothetical protein [Portunus trituberculatus]